MVAAFKKLMKWLASTVAVLIILLAIAVGAFRLLLPKLPEYQAQIKVWAEEALGTPVRFSQLNARWGLQGPEVTFYDAGIGEAPTGGSALLSAEEVRVGISLLNLVFRRQLTVDRVTLSETVLELERLEPNQFRFQGRLFTLDPTGPGVRVDEIPRFQVVLDDGQLIYKDANAGGRPWHFKDVVIRMQRTIDRLGVSIVAEPPESLGSRVEISAEADVETDDESRIADLPWRVFADVRDADLAGWSRGLPGLTSSPDEGNGDVSVWLEFQDRVPIRGTTRADLSGLVFPGQRLSLDNGDPYDAFRLTAEWERRPDGWNVSVSDLAIQRQDSWWPESGLELRLLNQSDDGSLDIDLRGDFLRLQDLTPLSVLIPEGDIRSKWGQFDPRGDVEDFSIALQRENEKASWQYAVEGRLVNIVVREAEQLPGLRGITATVRADTASGRVALDTSDARIAWQSLVTDAIPVDRLEGILVWRRSREGVRIVGDDLVLSNPDVTSRSSFELTLPIDGGSPVLELDTGVADIDLLAAKRYLPASKMKPGLVHWLERAWEGGRVPTARLSFFGPIEAFPFDEGEGQFRVELDLEGGRLRFAENWPAADEIQASVVFENAAMEAMVSKGRLLGNQASNTRIGFKDLRTGVLTVEGTTTGPLQEVLDFLASAPVIAERLGPRLQDVTAPKGRGTVDLDLSLPVTRPEEFQLTASLQVSRGELRVAGLRPPVTELEGELLLRETQVSGEDIKASFLGSPITLNVGESREDGYHTTVAGQGQVTAERLKEAFPYPVIDGLTGAGAYGGRLLFPIGEDAPPFVLQVWSDMDGIGSSYPAPLALGDDEPSAMQLQISFPRSDRMELAGQLDAERRFALRLEKSDDEFELVQGNFRMGGAAPVIGQNAGLIIDGQVSHADLSEWLGRLEDSGTGGGGIRDVLGALSLDIQQFHAFGQDLGETRLAVDRSAREWLIQIASENAEGSLFVPLFLGNRQRVNINMEKLWLKETVGEFAEVDPRNMPALTAVIRDFALGERRFGSLDATINTTPAGLVMTSFKTDHPRFTSQGEGSWLVEPQGQVTRIKADLVTSDVASALVPLGFDPFASASRGVLTADIDWPGGPAADWMKTVNGAVSVRMEDGSLDEIEPGAGRVFGLMSVSALPRRLALDFRDVFNKGLRFDSVTGSFTILQGNAYTNDLKLDGPVAEIGIVGRTGLGSRDYQQQAVVTAEVGKTLPAVGGILGGPGIGAALLLFTEIFKEPLKGIGRASYCVTGSWEEPDVERLTPAQLEEGELCADLPPSSMASRTTVP